MTTVLGVKPENSNKIYELATLPQDCMSSLLTFPRLFSELSIIATLFLKGYIFPNPVPNSLIGWSVISLNTNVLFNKMSNTK